MPVLDEVLDFVHSRQQQLVSEVERELEEHGLITGKLSLRGIVQAAHVFGRRAGFQLHQVGGVLFVGSVSQVAGRILETATKAVGHHGAARLSEVCREVSRRNGRRVDRQLTRRILQTRPDLGWLDEAGEWFWLAAVPRNRLLARVQKVLAIQPRIHLPILHQAISRDYHPLRVPEPIFRSVCAHFSWCRVGGEHLEAHVIPRAEDVLSEDEAVICDILQQHGGTMRVSRLQELSFARGVRRPGFWRILLYSPVVRRLDKATYGLVGSQIR
jgi:hypothetical protein